MNADNDQKPKCWRLNERRSQCCTNRRSYFGLHKQDQNWPEDENAGPSSKTMNIFEKIVMPITYLRKS